MRWNLCIHFLQLHEKRPYNDYLCTSLLHSSNRATTTSLRSNGVWKQLLLLHAVVSSNWKKVVTQERSNYLNWTVVVKSVWIPHCMHWRLLLVILEFLMAEKRTAKRDARMNQIWPLKPSPFNEERRRTNGSKDAGTDPEFLWSRSGCRKRFAYILAALLCAAAKPHCKNYIHFAICCWLASLTSCSPWAVQSTPLGPAIRSLCGRTIWRSDCKSPKEKKQHSLSSGPFWGIKWPINALPRKNPVWCKSLALAAFWMSLFLTLSEIRVSMWALCKSPLSEILLMVSLQ